MIKRFEWVESKSAAEAAKATTSTVAQLNVDKKSFNTGGGAIIKAGGIDVLDLMKEDLLPATRVVNIRGLKGLSAVTFEAGKDCTVGPLMTLAEIAQHKDIQNKFRALADAAGHIATPNIRNAATVGGNLLQRPRCWYFRSSDFHCLKKGGDHCFAIEGENKYHAIIDNQTCPIVHPSTMAVALVALDASIEILSASGATRSVKLENFFTSPSADVLRENTLEANEIITAIKIPQQQIVSAHIKLGEKESFDWSIADCAVALEMDGQICKKARIVLGAAAPVPLRERAVESFLESKTINEQTANEAAKFALKNAKILSQNAYKMELFRNLIPKTILAAASQR